MILFSDWIHQKCLTEKGPMCRSPLTTTLLTPAPPSFAHSTEVFYLLIWPHPEQPSWDRWPSLTVDGTESFLKLLHWYLGKHWALLCPLYGTPHFHPSGYSGLFTSFPTKPQWFKLSVEPHPQINRDPGLCQASSPISKLSVVLYPRTGCCDVG